MRLSQPRKMFERLEIVATDTQFDVFLKNFMHVTKISEFSWLSTYALAFGILPVTFCVVETSFTSSKFSFVKQEAHRCFSIICDT